MVFVVAFFDILFFNLIGLPDGVDVLGVVGGVIILVVLFFLY